MARGFGKLGFNGHARSCECGPCIKAKAAAMMEAWEANGKYAVPATPDATVFVNSYFRRQPNHLKTQPKTLAAVQKTVRLIRKLQKV